MLASERPAAIAALYGDARPWARFMAVGRPYLCPFGRFLDHVPRGARVLDIGCGNGLFLAQLAQNRAIGPSVGVDPGAGAVAAARRMAARLGAPLDFVETADPARWPAGPFEAVTLVDVLHHVPPALQPGLIAAAAARLAPGGVLLVKDIDPGRPLLALANGFHDLLLSRQWPRYLPPARLAALAGGLGLGLRHRADWRTLVYPHVLMVFGHDA